MKLTHIRSFVGFLRNKENAKATHDLGMILAVGSIIFNGSYNALAKGLTEFLSPFSLLILSEVLTAGFVMITFGLIPLVRTLSKVRGKEIFAAMLIGALSSGIGPLLWFEGLSRTTAVNASLLHGCVIIFVLLYGYLFLSETIKHLQFVGMLIITLGIGIITFGQFEAQLAINAGDGFIILSASVMAFGTILFKRYVHDLHPEAALFVRNISGILTALAIAAFFRRPFASEIRAFPMEQMFLLLSFAFFSRFLTLSFLYGALQKIPATSVALLEHATPIVSVFFAVLILNEKIYGYHILGIVFIIFGLVLEHISTQRVSKITRKVFLFRTGQHHVP